MTDRPIIFSAAMVRALLAGTKTQTRRLATSPLRRVEVGDRLYVREHWSVAPIFDAFAPRELPSCTAVHTCADQSWHNSWNPKLRGEVGKHRQGMHMPRWASRLTLIVEAVRVEPLQSVSEADAEAEGILRLNVIVDAHCAGGRHSEVTEDRFFPPTDEHIDGGHEYAADAYGELWDRLHTAPGQRYEDNPLVVALTFRVERRNIDAE